MMNFNLLDSRAGRDIFQMGKLEGKEEGKLEGRQEGKLEGKLEGRQEERLELLRKHVLSMLKKGFSIDVIAEITELSIQEIKKIQQSEPSKI